MFAVEKRLTGSDRPRLPFGSHVAALIIRSRHADSTNGRRSPRISWPAPYDDLRAVRWLGIRHGDDHLHLVATLVRQDGRTVWAWNDYRSAQAAARELEDRHGLHRIGQDRSAL